MTQWLIEEASFAALAVFELGNTPEAKEAERLIARHAELTAMKEAR